MLLDTGTMVLMVARVRLFFSILLSIVFDWIASLYNINVSLSVCSECECKGGRCDPRTGECRCPETLTGRQCDRCINEHNIMVTNGADVHCERQYIRSH